MNTFRTLRTPNAVTFMVVALGVFVRLYFALHHQGMWGVDGGSYAINALALLGLNSTHNDFVRPPLAPGWTLVPFLIAWGTDVGLKLWSVAATVPLTLAFAFVARRVLSPWQSVAAVYLLTVDLALAEMFAAGNLPMVGFAITFMAMWNVWNLATLPTWRHKVGLAVCIGLLPYVNQTATGIAAYVLPTFVLATGMVTGGARGIVNIARAVALPVAAGVLLALPALPYYQGVGINSPILRYPGPFVYFSTPASVGAYYQLALGLLAAWLVLRTPSPGFLRAVALLLIVVSWVCPFLSNDESFANILYRSRYFQMALLSMLAPWLVARYLLGESALWKRAGFDLLRPYLRPALGVMLALLSVAWVQQLHVESKFTRMVTPSMADAVAWVYDQPDASATLTNSYSLSNFVAAMSNEHSYWLATFAPQPAYRAQSEDGVCILGWRPGCDVAQAKADLATNYVLIEEAWPSYGEEAIQALEGMNPSYSFVNSFTRRPDQNYFIGPLWEAPDHPWDPAKRPAWLVPVWRHGTAAVYRIDLTRTHYVGGRP